MQRTKVVHSDNAPELLYVRKELARMRVEMTNSTSYNPDLNCLTVRIHTFPLLKMRAMLQFQKLDNG